MEKVWILLKMGDFCCCLLYTSDAFVAECNKENIDAVVVATVTEKPNLVMHWNGETIVDLERRFLDTNGVRVVVDAKVVDKDVKLPEERQTSAETLRCV